VCHEWAACESALPLYADTDVPCRIWALSLCPSVLSAQVLYEERDGTHIWIRAWILGLLPSRCGMLQRKLSLDSSPSSHTRQSAAAPQAAAGLMWQAVLGACVMAKLCTALGTCAAPRDGGSVLGCAEEEDVVRGQMSRPPISSLGVPGRSESPPSSGCGEVSMFGLQRRCDPFLITGPGVA